MALPLEADPESPAGSGEVLVAGRNLSPGPGYSPAAQPAGQTGGQPDAETATAPVEAGVDILLVDDDVRNLEVLESILDAPDYRLIRARTADEALLALVQRDFAAIVLDVRMPQMSGLELAQLIKQRKRSRHIPIIFLTAYFHDDKDVLSGYDAGAVDYLTKPINPQILKSKVGVFVELFRTTRALARANTSLEHEITQRRQAESARARLASIVESSSDAIMSWTPDGTIVSWNQGAERLLGYAASEIMGRSVSMLMPVDSPPEPVPPREAVLQGYLTRSFESVRLRKDRRVVDVSITFSALRDAAGNLTGISAIIRDIRERKRLEAEILHASDREQRRIAQDLHDGVGQQLAGISCLTAALADALARQCSPEARSASRISVLLNQAVAQTRSLAHGLHPVTPEHNGLMLALTNLAMNVSDVFRTDCRLECPAPVLIENNILATHLYRIAQEAVSNAIKHGQSRNIVINLLTTTDGITLTVRDNGIGLRKSREGERGMGVRIMAYRASALGGTLDIRPHPAGGTEVVCTISSRDLNVPESRSMA